MQIRSSRKRAQWMPLASAARWPACPSVSRTSSTPATCPHRWAHPSTRATAPKVMLLASRSRARLAAFCLAKPSPPNSPIVIRARRTILLTSRAPPAVHRAARRRRSVTTWCRSLSAHKPLPRRYGRRHSVAPSVTGQRMVICAASVSKKPPAHSTRWGSSRIRSTTSHYFAMSSLAARRYRSQSPYVRRASATAARICGHNSKRTHKH